MFEDKAERKRWIQGYCTYDTQRCSRDTTCKMTRDGPW